MKHRTRFIISGKLHCGKRHSLVVYAFSEAQAKEYASQHFADCRIK